MKRDYKALIVIVVLVSIAFFIFKNSMGNSVSDRVCIKNKACFNAEIADTDEKKVLGLGNRDFLWKNSGMLFVFEEKGIYGFWMKDMRFPIDIIWISKEMKISGIVKNFQPCESNEFCPVVYPDEEIAYALEINSGLSDSYEFEEGEEILLK